MNTIITSCQPREDILKGTFNPEIFTASLSEVIRFYRNQSIGIHPIYTDAKQFFTEGTYATDGLKMVVSEVFTRFSGDGSAPAIHRLETAFGGGKTHTLIACTHIAAKGKELKACVNDMLKTELLPSPGEVDIVGISGVELPVHKPHGTQLIPYTLWGEIAFQLGGETLYRDIEEDATSYASPGRNYFDSIFKGRKVLIMIDELAQYAARLTAARSDGSNQLSAFLMSLHEYARTNTNISIVVTLASSKDAFANETSQLAGLLSNITGKDMKEDDALGIGQAAVDSITSVIARDATSVIPVQASEISRVLAKRLFVSIDKSSAKETADQYRTMYRKNSAFLPDESNREDFFDRMVSQYPFHPTFVDFLNNKLATYENFQGTRGVLRVLALSVRTIWQKKAAMPMIHTCHLDLRNARIINEVVGRTGSSDLLTVLNADVGGADTDSLTGGRSNAELADRKNPHPEGWPLCEYTWKTIFLHSLVGRSLGLGSSIFGLTEPDALFEVSFPGLTPPQVSEALKEISNSAFYLRFNRGRYYASLDPSVNIALAKLRRGVQTSTLDDLLEATARKVVSTDISTFNIVPDVSAPEHIPDNNGKPTLALISLNADPIDIEKFVTTAGVNRPRIEQNLVFLLVPDTVQTKSGMPQQTELYESFDPKVQEFRRKLYDLARTVLAMRELKKNPQNHGINPEKLDEQDFKQRHNEREIALVTAVTESYKNLWYPSATGQIVCKEIRTSGGEGGVSVLEQIRKTLIDDCELITRDQINQSTLTGLKKMFFDPLDVVTVSKIRENFCRIRKWPILASPDLLDQLIREGVNRGLWCLFRMGNETSTKPDQFFSNDTGDLPLDVDMQKDYSLVTREGAKKRNWGEQKGPDKRRIQENVKTAAYETPIQKVSELFEQVKGFFGDMPDKDLKDSISKLIQEKRLMVFKGKVDQEETPELISGTGASFYIPESDDVIITPAKAAEKGWIKESEKAIRLHGKECVLKIIPMLRRIGSIYQRGGKSRIDLLDLAEMALPNGGTLRINLEKVSPESLKDLDEFFEVVDGLIQKTDEIVGDLEIDNPQDDCLFVNELKKDLK